MVGVVLVVIAAEVELMLVDDVCRASSGQYMCYRRENCTGDSEANAIHAGKHVPTLLG